METSPDLSATITALRRIAAPIGPLHSFWEVITDLEAYRDGRPHDALLSLPEALLCAQECLERARVRRPQS